MGYIYKATNTINGKVYIGQTTRAIDKRWREHILDSHNQNRIAYTGSLHRAIQKYSHEAFCVEQVEECDNAQLNSRESYWIGIFNSANPQYGYNLTTGGDSNYIKAPESIETRQKKSIAQIGIKNSFFGKHHSIAHRARISTPVVSFTDDGLIYKYYMSQIAANGDGYAQSHITDCVNGKVIHHGKTPTGERLRWRLATTEEQDVILRVCMDINIESLTPEQYNIYEGVDSDAKRNA